MVIHALPSGSFPGQLAQAFRRALKVRPARLNEDAQARGLGSMGQMPRERPGRQGILTLGQGGVLFSAYEEKEEGQGMEGQGMEGQ